MTPNFEVFDRQGKNALPTLKITKFKTGYLNRAARAALGDPERIVLLWSPDTRQIGIRAAEDGAGNSYRCGNDGQFGISAFLAYYGIPRVPQLLVGQLIGNILAFPAPTEAEA